MSDELRHPTLTQRGNQETRRARADLGCKKNFFHNATTLYVCLGRKMEECCLNRNNTMMKEIEKNIQQLTDFEFFAYHLGYTQILNIVVKASLNAQRSDAFASTSFQLVQQAFDRLRDLSENWSWEEEDLVFAGIGSPSQHMENLRAGFFQPRVSLRARKQRAFKINSLRQYRKEVDLEDEDPDGRRNNHF